MVLIFVKNIYKNRNLIKKKNTLPTKLIFDFLETTGKRQTKPCNGAF